MGNRKSTFLEGETDNVNPSSTTLHFATSQQTFNGVEKFVVQKMDENAFCRGGKRRDVSSMNPQFGLTVFKNYGYDFEDDDAAEDFIDNSEVSETIFNRAVTNLMYAIPGGAPFQVQFSGSFLGLDLLKFNPLLKRLEATRWAQVNKTSFVTFFGFQKAPLLRNLTPFTPRLFLDQNNVFYMGYVNETGGSGDIVGLVNGISSTPSRIELKGTLDTLFYTSDQSYDKSLYVPLIYWPKVPNGDINIKGGENADVQIETFGNGNVSCSSHTGDVNITNNSGEVEIECKKLIFNINGVYFEWPSSAPLTGENTMKISKDGGGSNGTLQTPFKLVWGRAILIYDDKNRK